MNNNEKDEQDNEIIDSDKNNDEDEFELFLNG